jgi:RNA-binding protein YlmH
MLDNVDNYILYLQCININQIYKKMDTKQEEKIKVPPLDWNSVLAKEFGVSKTTVTNAVRHNHPSKVCDKIRTRYKELYL